jgi:hypothetical protein
MRNVHLLFAAMAAVLASGTAAGQNVLVNGGFESNPPANLYNNIGHPIPPWVLGPGESSNVVKVDGGTGYGTSGPRLDADPATGPGVPQHYLDITDGSNDFYQAFTPPCGDTVFFGGSFSTRANSAGSASVRIVQGTGTGGPVVGATNAINLPPGNSRDDPWTPVIFSTVLTAGTTYSFVVQMNNNMNFDEGFVRYRTECNPTPPPQDTVSACCPPWNPAKLKSVVSYQGTGGIGANFTLRVMAPATAAQNAAVNTQLSAYLNYAHAVVPAVNRLRITYTLFDAGVGATPGPGGPLPGATSIITWNLSGTSTGGGFFAPGLLQVNRWYRLRSTIVLLDVAGAPVAWFNRECAVAEMFVRLQVQP